MYRLTVFDVNHSIDTSTMSIAPFDAYSLTASAFVIEKATNKSVPIVAFAAGEATDSFVVSSVETETKSNYTYDSGSGPTTVEVESSVIYIKAKRTQLAQAFALCLLLVNWALTIGSTYITLLVVFRKEEINDSVLLFPVTIVFAIPTLRSLYAGSPQSGIVTGKSGALRS